MTAEQFTTAKGALTCQGCGGTIPINTGIYLVLGGEVRESGGDEWACSPECSRSASLRRAINGVAIIVNDVRGILDRELQNMAMREARR